MVTSLREFDGKRLQSVAQGDPGFGTLEDEAEQQAKEQASTDYAGLIARLKAILEGTAHDVRVTTRLTTSPACIVADEPEIDFNLIRRMRGSGVPSQPVLEINPEHPLVRRLNRDPDDPRLDAWAHVLWNQAVLTLGARVDDPAAFVGQLNDLLVALAGETDQPAAGRGTGGKRAAGGTRRPGNRSGRRSRRPKPGQPRGGRRLARGWPERRPRGVWGIAPEASVSPARPAAPRAPRRAGRRAAARSCG